MSNHTISTRSSKLRLKTRRSNMELTDADSSAPRHSYNTRYSARFTPSSNSLLTPENESNWSNANSERCIFEAEQEQDYSDDSNASFLLPNCVNDLQICARYWKPESRMRVREYNNVATCYPCPNNANRWLKPLTFFITLGVMVLTMLYLNEQYNKTCGSMGNVAEDIKTIKQQVDGMKSEVDKVAQIRDETEKKLLHIEGLISGIKQEAPSCEECPSPSASQEPVKTVVQEMLEEYDADKTGKTDFALESAGGSIVSTKDTENFLGASNTLTLFGVPLCESSNNPRAMIQPGMAPGQCWAFKGAKGQAIVKLLAPVKINGVSLEHISKSISPSGEISTAPKEFSVWGLEKAEGQQEELLGKFSYDINGPSLQYFNITASSPFEYVAFKVHSNHGHEEFTCVYRLRIHGSV